MCVCDWVGVMRELPSMRLNLHSEKHLLLFNFENFELIPPLRSFVNEHPLFNYGIDFSLSVDRANTEGTQGVTERPLCCCDCDYDYDYATIQPTITLLNDIRCAFQLIRVRCPADFY